MEVKRVNVLDVGIHALDMPRALEVIVDALDARRKGYVCVTGVHGVMEAQRDAELRDTLNRAFLNLPDGMPTVWVGRLRGHHGMRRVFGPDMMAEVCRLSTQRGYRHFLYGGAAGVAEELRFRLMRRFPGLRVVGTHSPPFRLLDPGEESELERQIARLRPDVMWIGLSTPKQERFMARHWRRLDTTLMIGVGAAFDFHTGRIKDAPGWMNQRPAVAHRLAQDPQRLWKRYATTTRSSASDRAAASGVSEYRHRRRERAWQRSAAHSSRRDEAGVSEPAGTCLRRWRTPARRLQPTANRRMKGRNAGSNQCARHRSRGFIGHHLVRGYTRTDSGCGSGSQAAGVRAISGRVRAFDLRRCGIA
jgi:N-acetylglucosaminyldiphosphoundecaprenol N-acetyl-beta-D-mannosaminyltransferase